MLDTQSLGEMLSGHGFNLFSGVPCSHLKDLINYAISNCEYVAATNEGDALAVCSGANMAGKKSVFLCQNSGLSNAVSPLTSLNVPFELPVLGFTSFRGDPDITDEPQHQLLGQITPSLLEQCGVSWEFLSSETEEVAAQLVRAQSVLAEGRSFFFIVRKGTLAPYALDAPAHKPASEGQRIAKTDTDSLPSRESVLEALSELAGEHTALMATTGHTGRELFEVEDRAGNFYMVGSMGCLSSLGLGVALGAPGKEVVCVDGDGALLMRLGNLATNGIVKAENLLHILLDNECHASTGGQASGSEHVDFVAMAHAAGYPVSAYCHSIAELTEKLIAWRKAPALTFLYLRISKQKKDGLGRPSVSPAQVRERFSAFLRK